MSGPEGSSNKHCIVCAVGIFCPEHSTIVPYSVGENRRFFLLVSVLGNKKGRQSDETEIDRPSIKGKALYEFAVKMLNRAHQIFCSDEAK